MPITIHPIPAFNDNYFWLIINDENKQAVVVDPGNAQPVLDTLQAKDLNLAAILITHHHTDHTGGITDLLNSYDIPVYGPAEENIHGVSNALKEGESVTIPAINTTFEIFDVPGHTLGHIAYYSAPHLFCGDTLFAAGCGRLFEGTPSQMWHSLQKFKQLPVSTLIYCAHEYTANNLAFAKTVDPKNDTLRLRIQEVTKQRANNQPTLPATLTIELQTNPFLRTDQQSIQQTAQNYTNTATNLDEIQVFAAIRSMKDSF